MRLIRFFAFVAALTLLSVTLPAQAVKKAPKASEKAPKASEKAAEKASSQSAVANSDSLVDINHATAADLKTIPGIGDAYSAAIVKGRPYANKTQLKTRNILPPAVYEKVKDKIIAKQ